MEGESSPLVFIACSSDIYWKDKNIKRMGYNNNFYGWSFNDVNGKAVDLRPDIDGVTEEELSDALKAVTDLHTHCPSTEGKPVQSTFQRMHSFRTYNTKMATLSSS